MKSMLKTISLIKDIIKGGVKMADNYYMEVKTHPTKSGWVALYENKILIAEEPVDSEVVDWWYSYYNIPLKKKEEAK